MVTAQVCVELSARGFRWSKEGPSGVPGSNLIFSLSERAMETSLHRQLKEYYARSEARYEVPVDGFRIDVVNGKILVEIQHGSLAAIRDKLRQLLKRHTVHVVKPIVARKCLVKQSRKGGREKSRRWSPKRRKILSIFDELVYFTKVFPHKRLTLHVPLVEVEELRYPGHGRRRWRRATDFEVEDQQLTEIVEEVSFRTLGDLCRLLPENLPSPFHTGDLAEQLAVERMVAQRMAYCLREMKALRTVGKQGNAWLYEVKRSAAVA